MAVHEFGVLKQACALGAGLGRGAGYPGYKSTKYNIRANAGSLVIDLFGAKEKFLANATQMGVGE